jgi:hypothetical protein
MTSKRAKPTTSPKASPEAGERKAEWATGGDPGGPQEAGASVAGVTSRARSRPGLDSTVAERVGWCIYLMTQPDGWNGYLTRAELVMVWEVDDSTVRRYAAEASRTLALDEDGREQAKLAHAAALLATSRRAENTFNAMTGMPDFASAIKARETAAKFQGIVLATGVEVTGKGGGPVAMTLDDVDEALKAAHANAAESGAPSEKND